MRPPRSRRASIFQYERRKLGNGFLEALQKSSSKRARCAVCCHTNRLYAAGLKPAQEPHDPSVGPGPSGPDVALSNPRPLRHFDGPRCLVGKQSPSWGMTEDAPGGASEDEFSQTRVPVRTHDEEIDRVFAYIFLERAGNCCPIASHIFSNGVHTMSNQVRCEPRSSFGLGHRL